MNNTDELKDNQGLIEERIKSATNSNAEKAAYDPGVHRFNRQLTMVQMTHLGIAMPIRAELNKQRHSVIINSQSEPYAGRKN